MNKKEKLCKFLLSTVVIIISLISITSTAFAKSKVKNPKIGLTNESKAHKEWRLLSKEEKERTPEPAYTTLSLKDSIKRSEYNAMLKGVDESVDLENKYSLKDNIQIRVEDQKNTNTCWTFATTSALETTVAKKYNIYKQYSPMHMAYTCANLFGMDLSVGGNFNHITAYLSNGYGPANDDDLKFEDVYDSDKEEFKAIEDVELNQEITAKVNETVNFAHILKNYNEDETDLVYMDDEYNEYTEEQVNAIRNQIKEHIKKYGGVIAQMYYPSEQMADYKVYYNKENSAVFYNVKGSSAGATHAVTLVGWDDNYSKDKFNSIYPPIHNGAWIVLDSYGEQTDDNGYLYVSYDDFIIEQNLMGIKDVTEYSVTDQDYDNYYTHSELGTTMNMPFYLDEWETGVWVKNVYSRKDAINEEYINKASFYLYETSGVELYIDKNNDGNMELISSKIGDEALEPGFHTIDLTPIKLENDNFAIAIKLINQEKGCINVAVEWNQYQYDTDNNIFYTDGGNVKSEPEESYYSFDGESWEDVYYVKLDNFQLKNCNFIVDAYTTVEGNKDYVPVTGVEFVNKDEMEKGIEIEVDDVYVLEANVLPSDATYKQINWTSSNEEVAYVSKSGVIRGIGEGKATIKGVTEDGSFEIETTVNVIAKNDSEEIPVEGIELNTNKVTIKEGERYVLKANITPENATNKNVNWSIEDESIASIEEGLVIGLKEGTTKITAITEDGEYEAYCTLVVEKKEEINEKVAVTGVKTDKTEVQLEVGAKTTIVATVQPENATNKNVTWKSLDESIASVSNNGIITANKEGKTSIVVTTEDGMYEETIEVTVTKKENNDDDIYKPDTDKKDDTVAPSLPQTGEKIGIIIAIITVTVLGGIFVKKYIKYNY